MELSLPTKVHDMVTGLVKGKDTILSSFSIEFAPLQSCWFVCDFLICRITWVHARHSVTGGRVESL